jgi:hypothetical protein
MAPRKIVTDQLRSHQAAKAEISELAQVRARLHPSRRENTSDACVAFAILPLRRLLLRVSV